MKRVLIVSMFVAVLASCKDQKQTAENQSVAEQPLMFSEATHFKEGYGKVKLMCGSQIITVEGICGGDTSSGDMIVAVQDKTIPTKVFTIVFNGKEYPQSGKAYTIKKSDFISDKIKPRNEIYVGLSEINQKNQMDWSSDDASGTLQFETHGNEIKCTFKDIRLQPSMMYNKTELKHTGTASGTITFYKN